MKPNPQGHTGEDGGELWRRVGKGLPPHLVRPRAGGTLRPEDVQAERMVSAHRFRRGQGRQDGLELVAVPGAEEGP